MKKLIIVYIVLIVAVILLAITRAGGLLPPLPFLSGAEADINGKKIKLIMAKSEEDRMKGLSGRDKLNEDQGMLFVFEKKDIYPFWMKEMKFSIDIIYIDGNIVVDIIENASPPKGQADPLQIFRSDKPADKVLELNAGGVDEYGIEEGSEINFKGI